jgi:predicted dehydrogenase
VYDRWEDVIRDPDIEVVHTCTPNNLHYVINKAALLAGKHVLSEKPLAMTSRESADLVRIAKKTRLRNGVHFNYRFYPLIQHARKMVEGGELGDILLVHGHYLQDWLLYATDTNWRVDPAAGGASRAFADIGSHWCDLVQFVTGLRIKQVCATLATIHRRRADPAGAMDTFKGKESHPQRSATVRIRTEDTGIVMLEFSNGARGVVTVSQVSAGRKNREWFEIDGSKNAIVWDQEDPNSLWVGHREKPNEIVIKDPALLHPEARRYAHYPGGHPEGYPDGPKNLFLNFYDAVRSGGAPHPATEAYPTFADGHHENCIVDAVLKSNRRGGWVPVRT